MTNNSKNSNGNLFNVALKVTNGYNRLLELFSIIFLNPHRDFLSSEAKGGGKGDVGEDGGLLLL